MGNFALVGAAVVGLFTTGNPIPGIAPEGALRSPQETWKTHGQQIVRNVEPVRVFFRNDFFSRASASIRVSRIVNIVAAYSEYYSKCIPQKHICNPANLTPTLHQACTLRIPT